MCTQLVDHVERLFPQLSNPMAAVKYEGIRAELLHDARRQVCLLIFSACFKHIIDKKK